jgi:hypothetical protein
MHPDGSSYALRKQRLMGERGMHRACNDDPLVWRNTLRGEENITGRDAAALQDAILVVEADVGQPV